MINRIGRVILQAMERSGVVVTRPSVLAALQENIISANEGAENLRSALAIMAAQREGYKAAYEAVSSERTGYKAAYEAVSSERTGYKAAYEAVSSERTGYKAAYEAVSSERTGYKAAYEAVSSERTGYKAAYELTMTELAYARSVAPVAPKAAKVVTLGTVDLPSIAVISIPKSGTVYTNGLLTSGLCMPGYDICMGNFPKDMANHRAMTEFATGGFVSASHLDASSFNLAVLRRFLKQWVVLLRDPRSVLLSWVHHIEYYRSSTEQDTVSVYPIIYDSRYFNMSLADRIDWNIKVFLPCLVEWTNDWLTVIDKNEDRILLVTHDELACDERAFIQKVLDFYDVPVSRFKMPALIKTIEASHYRVGRTDEWRDVFSAEQVDRANHIVGEELLARFCWPQR